MADRQRLPGRDAFAGRECVKHVGSSALGLLLCDMA